MVFPKKNLWGLQARCPPCHATNRVRSSEQRLPRQPTEVGGLSGKRFVRGSGGGAVAGLGDEVPQKLKHFIKLRHNFDVFDHEKVQHVLKQQWAMRNTRDQLSVP